jgi:hypothetical protein
MEPRAILFTIHRPTNVLLIYRSLVHSIHLALRASSSGYIDLFPNIAKHPIANLYLAVQDEIHQRIPDGAPILRRHALGDR